MCEFVVNTKICWHAKQPIKKGIKDRSLFFTTSFDFYAIKPTVPILRVLAPDRLKWFLLAFKPQVILGFFHTDKRHANTYFYQSRISKVGDGSRANAFGFFAIA